MSAAGRMCLGLGEPQVCPVICCNGVGRRQVGRGRQGSQETSRWPPFLYFLRKQGRHYVLALWAWGGSSQAAIAPGRGLSSLGKQPASDAVHFRSQLCSQS